MPARHNRPLRRAGLARSAVSARLAAWALCGSCLAIAVGDAQADTVQLFGELRLGLVGTAASAGQLGPDPAEGPGRCSAQTQIDGGGSVAGTGVAVLTGNHYRYQLGLSAGYYQYDCTPSLTRPIGGLDFRGEHHFGERTVLTTTLHGGVDAFDRSVDLRSGVLIPGTSAAAGKPYLAAAGSVELEHSLTGHSGLRGTLSAQTMQLLAPLSDFSSDATLGPMEAAELKLTPFFTTPRDRWEVPVRFALSHYYAASQDGVVSRWRLTPAQDGSLSLSWERHFSPLLSLRVEGGFAIADQPSLCVYPELPSHSCSIDHGAPGVRGRDEAPPFELHLGPLATATLVGSIELRRQTRQQLIQIELVRAYEPSYYASALSLTDRLGGSLTQRLTPDLYISGGVQLAHLAFSVPARVTSADNTLNALSPQDRSLFLLIGLFAVDWAFAGPVALFAEGEYQGLDIRGAQVNQVGDSGASDPTIQVAAFPGGGAYQGVSRVTLLVGLRLFTRPPPREASALFNGRAYGVQ